MKNKKIVITIIIATYNCVKYIEQCLKSITLQNYLNIELIVIDGGSTDGTVEVIKKYSNTIYYWISEKDNGLSNAWNKAIEKSSGDWLYFMGGDDFLTKESIISECERILINCPKNINIAYGNIILTTEQGIPLYIQGQSWELSKELFKSQMSIPHQGVFHRMELFKKYGNFNEEYKITADYELLMRELKNNDAFYLEGINVAYMRRGGLSTHRKNTFITLIEFAKVRKKHLRVVPGILWYLKILKEIIRILLLQMLGEKLVGKILNIKLKIQKKPTVWNK